MTESTLSQSTAKYLARYTLVPSRANCTLSTERNKENKTKQKPAPITGILLA